MIDIAALERLREEAFFNGWAQFVPPDLIRASENSLRRLVDDLLALGLDLSEQTARAAVRDCVRRFNDLDGDGWICTTEREDICEQIERIFDLCGFEFGDDAVEDREW